MHPVIEHFQRMARYNTVANTRLYDVVGTLPAAEFEKPRKGFFSSIQGTLNHLMIGDGIWLARFDGRSMLSTDLDSMPYPAFADLRAAREALDSDIEARMAALHPAWLPGEVAYVDNAGVPRSDPILTILAHFFNHQTHHRGQVHDMLSQTGVETPVLDLHRCLHP